MQNNNNNDKYNIILIILLFVIPIFALNLSFYFFAKIKDDIERNEQEKNAVHEAEVLSAEADFTYQFSGSFRKFFDVIKSDSEVDFKGKSLFTNHLEQKANIIFANPFPKFNLYVFKKTLETSPSELFYSKGEIKGGEKSLCRAFDYLVNIILNGDNENKIKDKNCKMR